MVEKQPMSKYIRENTKNEEGDEHGRKNRSSSRRLCQKGRPVPKKPLPMSFSSSSSPLIIIFFCVFVVFCHNKTSPFFSCHSKNSFFFFFVFFFFQLCAAHSASTGLAACAASPTPTTRHECAITRH